MPSAPSGAPVDTVSGLNASRFSENSVQHHKSTEVSCSLNVTRSADDPSPRMTSALKGSQSKKKPEWAVQTRPNIPL